MPTQPDATIDFLDRLKDESKWTIVRGVPVFKPHRRTVKGKNGNPDRIIEVTREDLRGIVTNASHLQSEHGVVSRIMPGHIDPAKAETEQPPIYGYGTNYRVGTFGEKSQLCILADLYYLNEYADDAKQYPFRSAEYYPDKQEIRGIALLKRDPYLDLGMVAYKTPAGICYHYAMPMEPTEQTTDGDELTPDEEKSAERYMCHYKKRHPWIGHAMQQYDAFAGPNNMATPATEPKPAAPTMPKPDGVPDEYRMQYEQLMIRYSQREEVIESLQKRVVNLEESGDRKECERLVIQLEAEHYQLDRAVEVEDLVERDADKRPARLAYIRKHYKRVAGIAVPVPYAQGDTVPVYDGDGTATETAELGLMVKNDAERDRVLTYMRDRNVSWDEAKEAVLAPAK